MCFTVTDWLQNLSVSLTSSPRWCECILNSLSLRKACTLSLHQDELSKMEDEQALAGKETGNATFGELAWDPNLSDLFECCAKGERLQSVCLSLSIVEMLGYGCLRDLLHAGSTHRKIPIVAHLFPV